MHPLTLLPTALSAREQAAPRETDNLIVQKSSSRSLSSNFMVTVWNRATVGAPHRDSTVPWGP